MEPDPEDPGLDLLMRQILAFGYGTPEYHWSMWMLLSVMARRQAIIADRIEQGRRDSERRRGARKKA
jgi:hypothetical protein